MDRPIMVEDVHPFGELFATKVTEVLFFITSEAVLTCKALRNFTCVLSCIFAVRKVAAALQTLVDVFTTFDSQDHLEVI